tara:strand:+ start:4996 stop:5481 length:486 start_codon:yes stop_codon:yes gene_type:complete
MKKAIYPGSFDPITYGHLDIIERSSKLFDNLVIAVIKNNDKTDFLLSQKDRVLLIEDSISKFDNVEVKVFEGLLMDFAKKENSDVIIRGLRVLSDFEYEFKMALMNRKLDENINTLFMMPHEKYTHISSSLIKEVANLGGKIDDYVSKEVSKKLKQKLNKK